MIGVQRTQALCYILFPEPLNFPRGRFRNPVLQPLRMDQMNGARAILAYMDNHPDDILGRYLEAFAQF